MSHSANFLHRAEPAPVHRRHGIKRGLVIAATLVATVLVGYAIWLAVALGALYAAASDGRAALEAARDAAESLDFDTALFELERADERFARADRNAAALLPLEFLPWVAPQARAASALAAAGRSAVEALKIAATLGADLARLSGLSAADLQALSEGASPGTSLGDLPSATKRLLLRRLVASADELDETAERIAIARAELAQADREGVASGTFAALVPLAGKLAQAEETLRLLSRAARVLPAFAGIDGSKTSLLLFLNDAELRPGGGFIGTYGALTVKDADIAALYTHDAYALDGPAEARVTQVPPEPLRRWLGAQKWFFRDANWSPDFAASSRDALRLFRSEQELGGGTPTAFDGVIGFTPAFAADLLRLTGPIEAGGQTFSSENVYDKLEYQVEVGYAGQGIPLAQRKEIVAELVERMKARLEAMPVSRWGEIAQAAERALVAKSLLLYSEDPSSQRVIDAVGWGGRVASPAWGDALMAVDANLASLKTDPAVKRTLRYETFKNSSGQYVGRVTIHYDHEGRFDWKTTRYRTYARVYVPAGSEFIRVTGALKDDRLHEPSGAAGGADVGQELGFTVFGAFTSIEPGTSRDLVFEYLLAPSVVESIASGSYRLKVFKQAGAQEGGLTLRLDFDKNVTSASVPEGRDKWGNDVYELETVLDKDRVFEVAL
ncbi:DUF4012 domain-containing protein [Patescibacteria group bacterium]|nr:MAG: DUF4012 domain-containing protein [Patescibacteria group bacterium]